MTARVPVDLQKETDRITSFIKDHVKRAVIGLSGGIDSSLSLALTVRAIGKENVLGLLMPSGGVTPSNDIQDAEWLAKNFAIRSTQIDIKPIFERFTEKLPASHSGKTPTDLAKDKNLNVALGNLRARIRMCILYFFANLEGRMVIGTGDRSEHLIGYFTKFGDGGTDIEPIGHLYKTEVRAMGKLLGLPERIYAKPSSPQLWAGHKATDEIPADYPEMDPIFMQWDDKIVPKGELSRTLERMNKESEHKRTTPLTLDRVPSGKNS